MIRTVKFRKYYGRNRGVECLDLEVFKGEIFGFIGPNGAGKSTTIRSLLGFIKPTEGELFLFDTPCTDKNLAMLKTKIGYLPSEVNYYENMKVGQLLRYAARYYNKDCTTRINELCDYFELDQKRLIEDLSYGNRKKVAVVQAFMHLPELLILDEPTGGLDPLIQNKFFELIKKEHARGATVFFSSHILSEVQKLCHRVGIIKDGFMIQVKSLDALKGTQYKKVVLKLSGGSQFNQGDFILRDLNIENGEVRFIYEGDVNDLACLMSNLRLDDFSVQEPDLEEIFMHYYSDK